MEQSAGGPVCVSFVGGATGTWRVDRCEAVVGESLATAARVEMGEGVNALGGVWVLRGATSNTRYTTRAEAAMLKSRQEGLGRSQARCAALIPIRKSAAWWAMAQDERRAIFEEDSHHITIGAEYLPGIARRLHHCRELGEPFDFLTWFEYAPEHGEAFEQMVARLRATREWSFVEREIDIRLSRS